MRLIIKRNIPCRSGRGTKPDTLTINLLQNLEKESGKILILQVKRLKEFKLVDLGGVYVS